MMPKKNSPWFDQTVDDKKYPSLSGTETADVAIIGGGIAGVMAAFYLSQKNLKVVLLEKNRIATGDTGASTGFLTRVPDVSLHELAEKQGVDFVKKIFEASRTAQQTLIEIITGQSIDCEFRPCTSHFGAYQKKDSSLKKEWGIIQQTDPLAAWMADGDAKGVFAEAVQYRDEAMFNPRKFVFGVLKFLGNSGVQIFEESEILSADFSADPAEEWMLKTENGSVKAKKIIVTAGFPPDFFAELQSLLKPYITYVCAAEYAQMPLLFQNYWDTESPYFYFRRIGEKTLLVGGADIESSKTGEQNAFEKLETFLREHFSGNFSITNQWSGSIFHTADGLPYFFEHPHRKNLYVGMGFGGNGLVFGALAGKILSELVMGNVSEESKLFSWQRTGAQIQKSAASAVSTKGKKEFVIFGTEEEFSKKNIVCKTIGGVKVSIFKVNGKYFALQNACTHAGGSLSDGILEGKVIECPLHGAKFDITTGEVLGPPAMRKALTYPVHVKNGNIEVKTDIGEIAKTEVAVGVKLKKQSHWGSLLKFSAAAILFWLAEAAYQFYGLKNQVLDSAILRASALSGATFFGLALFSSAIFRWFPKFAAYWRLRRYLGVGGFIFAALHVFYVYKSIYDFDILAVYYTFNPFENPVVFGSIAFPIFFIMAATSTDWAVNKLTPKVWKFIHRFVYLAYWATIFHFLLINPLLLKNVAGYLLLAVTACAIFGEFFWFVKTIVARKSYLSIGTAVGLLIIVLYLATAYIAYFVLQKPLL